jgi:hypothetical protein
MQETTDPRDPLFSVTAEQRACFERTRTLLQQARCDPYRAANVAMTTATEYAMRLRYERVLQELLAALEEQDDAPDDARTDRVDQARKAARDALPRARETEQS